MAAQASGANALAVARVMEPEPAPERQQVKRLAPEIAIDTAATLDELPRSRKNRAAQPSLFGAEMQPRIIPFDSLPKSEGGPAVVQPAPSRPGTPAAEPLAMPGVRGIAPKPPAKTNSPRSAAVDDTQATLDFLPPVRNTARTLKTNAEAVIFCDAAVAAPVHRATAAVLDLCMILSALGIVLLIFQEVAKPAALDRTALVLLGGMLGLIALWYGLLFAIAGSLTPGMRWTHLRLINFDGFPLDGRSRALRMAGAWIGVLSGGVGLFWALLDEEGLTWHDHMSKTFPTLQESNSIVVRQRHS